MKNAIDAIIRFFTELFGRKYGLFTGVIDDLRLPSEIMKDWLHEERALAAPTDPFGNDKLIGSPYPYYNQFTTFSCVPHGVGLSLALERYMDGGNAHAIEQIAPTFVYRQRSNYADEGSSLPNIFGIYKTKGAPLYTTLPTPQTEVQANAQVLTTQMFTEAEIYKGKDYFIVANYSDIATLANIAQFGHGVAILFFSTEEEYAQQYPQILNPSLNKYGAPIRHCVCIVPKSGFIENGVKYLMVQDSSWFGGWKYHYLSEAFIKARVYAAGYWDTVSVIGTGARPKYTFTKTLRYGDTNAEVKVVQELLISEGLLPTGLNSGYFGGRTLAGVNAFQSRYAAEILLPNGLTAPTGLWGPACIAKANVLCA